MTSKIVNEKGVKRDVKKLLDAHRWFWWMPAANGFGATGIADFCAVRGGVFMAVETKFGYNKPTPVQTGFLVSVQSENCFAFVVNEKNLDVFADWLKAFDRSVARYADGGTELPDDGALMIDAIRELTKDIA